MQPAPVLRGVFVAAQEFVSFDLSHHSDAAWLVGFGALHAAEATNFDRAGESDFMRQSQQNLDRGAAGDFLW